MTHMLDRAIAARISKSRKSLLLLGARQVGKSTFARSLKPDTVINLADEDAFLGYSKDPGRLGRELRALQKPALVLVDEVQRIPRLLNTIQALLDEASGHRFLLTGSSARKLKRGQANLLPGRIIVEHLDPLLATELRDNFSLARALRVGMLPGIYLDEDAGEDILGSYVATYLREEIQAEALTRDLGSYARFLDLAAETSGQWLNYSKIASDAEIPKETIRRFFQILEDTLIAFRLPAFEPKRSLRRVSQRDRVFIFDVGVRNALLGLHRQPLPATELGGVFEQWLILQTLYTMRACHKPWRLSSYRTEAGAEVDLIIDTGRSLLAVECKAGRNVRSGSLGGIRSFFEVAHKPAKAVVVYQGDRRQRLDARIEAVPFAEFLADQLPAL